MHKLWSFDFYWMGMQIQQNWVMDIFDITKGVGISLSAGAFHMEAYFTSTKDFCQIDPAYINKW